MDRCVLTKTGALRDGRSRASKVGHKAEKLEILGFEAQKFRRLLKGCPNRR